MKEKTTSTESPTVTRRALFLGFLEIGISGFGGVLPWARRVLVERRQWLTPAEFNDALGLGQVLPGPNVGNLSIVVGRRFHGAIGSVLAFSGLMLAPLVIVLALGVFYNRYGHHDIVQRVFSGVAAAAAGLFLVSGIKMALALPRSWRTALIVVAAFIATALLRLPLPAIIAVVVPVSIGLAWRYRE